MPWRTKYICATVAISKSCISTHCLKSVRIRGYSGPHFPAFGVNTEGYDVSLRIESECGKVITRITPNTDTFYAMYILVFNWKVNPFFYNVPFWSLEKHRKNFGFLIFLQSIKSECMFLSCHAVYVLIMFLARSRPEIWSLSDCSWTRNDNHLVHKRTLNHLASYSHQKRVLAITKGISTYLPTIIQW